MAEQDVIIVNLQTLTDVKYAVKVKRTGKVADLKTKLWQMTGIRNKIKLLKNKEELDDGRQIGDHAIDDGNVIQMLLAPPEAIGVIVHILKKGRVKLDVNDNHTAGESREMLLDEDYGLGITPNVYQLYYKSKKLECDKPLHVYGISDDCEILLESPDASFKLQIISANPYKMKDLVEVRGTDTVLQLKNRVIDSINKDNKNPDREADVDHVIIFHEPRNETLPRVHRRQLLSVSLCFGFLFV